MIRGARYAVIAAMTILTAACASTLTPATEYLLRSDAPFAADRDAPVHLSRLSVRVAPYLDRSGIVVETEGREVHPAQTHVWAEPLHDALTSLLLDEIAHSLGGSVTTNIGAPHLEVEVAVDRFHGAVNGRVVMVADCRVSRAGVTVTAFRFVDELDQSTAGYPALVAAQAELASRLARAIAEALETSV